MPKIQNSKAKIQNSIANSKKPKDKRQKPKTQNLIKKVTFEFGIYSIWDLFCQAVA